MDWLGCQNLLLYSLNFDFKVWLWASEPDYFIISTQAA